MPNHGPFAAEFEGPSLRSSLVSVLASARFQVFAITAAAAPIYLFKLGTGALLDWDEAIYAEVSKEMYAAGHWLTPTWQHQPFFEKPPLSFWIQAAFFHAFGATEFWARFPSALAAIAIVLLTFAIARRLAGPAAGLFTAFALMTMNHFDRVAREGMTDTLLCLCIYLAIHAWMRLRRDQPIWFYLLCAAIGGGAMIKGPAVFVAPLAIAVDCLFAPKPERLPARRHCVSGVLLALAIAVPWHIWMILRYGHAFVQTYFGFQLAGRATGVIQGSGGAPFYYLEIVFRGAFPWSLIALCAAVRWIWKKQWNNSLMWVIAGVLLIGYSLVPTKHNWYILPIYPALAVEVGSLLADAGACWRVIRHASMAAVAAGMIIAFVKLAQRRGDSFTNQVAQLASTAGRAAHAAPLLVIPDPGPDSQLDVPTIAFYSGSRVVFLAMPGDNIELTRLLRSYKSEGAIIQNGALSNVSRSCFVQVKAQNSAAAYVELSAR